MKPRGDEDLPEIVSSSNNGRKVIAQPVLHWRPTYERSNGSLSSAWEAQASQKLLLGTYSSKKPLTDVTRAKTGPDRIFRSTVPEAA